MRIVRRTMWQRPSQTPEALLFFRESDLINLEEALREFKRPIGGIFQGCEVFEIAGDPDIARVSILGLGRYQTMHAKTERDQATLYFYNADSLARVSPGGILFNSRPHPLNADQIKDVFEQLAHHPTYQYSQTVTGFGTDRMIVTLRHGLVTIGSEIVSKV